MRKVDLVKLALWVLLGQGLLGCESVAGLEEREVYPGGGGAAGGGGAGGSGGGGGAAVASRWPDSPAADCTDGEELLDDCPQQGEPGYGQDGNYTYNLPDYESGDGTVTDSITGLEWDEDSSLDAYDWEGAKARCDERPDGWRLPSRLELASLLNLGGPPPKAGWKEDLHWSSSATGDSSDAWAAGFLEMNITQMPKSEELFVLCVRGDPLASDFVEVDADVLWDRTTGLEWQRNPGDSDIPWLDALNHCEAAKGGWRLPSAKELTTLVDPGEQMVPGLEGQEGRYWTSSPGFPWDVAHDLQFPDGTPSHQKTSFPNYVRCVRGPSGAF
jgi:hypothetical protein